MTFFDDFELGNFSRWDSTRGAVSINGTEVYAGAYSARVYMTGIGMHWLQKTYVSSTELIIDFYVLFKVRPATKRVVISRITTYIPPWANFEIRVISGTFQVWTNDSGYINSGVAVALDTWYHLRFWVCKSPVPSLVELQIDDVQRVYSEEPVGDISWFRLGLWNASDDFTVDAYFDGILPPSSSGEGLCWVS